MNRRSEGSSGLIGGPSVVMFLSFSLATAVFAQSTPPGSSDSARCETALNTPTRDTALVEYQALFFPYDSTQHLPNSYRELLGQGLREEFKVPQPLAVNTYQANVRFAVSDPTAADYAVTTLRSMYRFVLHRDGHLTNARAVGGVRNIAFNDAVIGALVRLDSEQMLPPGSDSIGFDHDTLDVRLTITPGFMASSHFSGKSPTTAGVTPLFRLRLPVRPIDKALAAVPGNRPPRYPPSMREQHLEGEVRAEFVARPDGTVDPTSIQMLKATNLEFASAVLQALVPMHFYPMQIAGCAVTALIQMPFMFSLNY